MWDIITRDKAGIPKEHNFSQWCTWIARHSAATEHAAASSAATEHADADPFRKLAEHILTYELTPEQMNDPVYSLRRGRSITAKQRSFINSLLRKNLGDPRVAYYIFEHGIPTLLYPPFHNEKPSKAMLQNMLEEFMTWHARLLHYLLEGQQQPNAIIARRLSDPGQQQWQAERRRQKAEIQRRLRQGADLAMHRDSGKRKFDDMAATEQQTLEDYDCKRLQRQHEELRVQNPQHFGRKKP